MILIAFLLGLARVPVAVLGLIGRLAPAGQPGTWSCRGVFGLIQFVITPLMLADYRRFRIWGAR